MAEATELKPTESKLSSKKVMYRPLVNWRHGSLYQEGEVYDLQDIPKAAIESAIAAGYLEVV